MDIIGYVSLGILGLIVLAVPVFGGLLILGEWLGGLRHQNRGDF